jgi:hypothetical protein
MFEPAQVIATWLIDNERYLSLYLLGAVAVGYFLFGAARVFHIRWRTGKWQNHYDDEPKISVRHIKVSQCLSCFGNYDAAEVLGVVQMPDTHIYTNCLTCGAVDWFLAEPLPGRLTLPARQARRRWLRRRERLGKV